LPFLLLIVGCVDLTLAPSDEVWDGAYFRTLGDFRAATIGIYDQMSIADWYGRSLPLMADIMGEDVKQGVSCRYGLADMADFQGQVISGHGYETELWAEVYEAVNMANRIINATYEPPDAVRVEFDQLIGEAHAARALAYFDLVRMFGQHYTFTADASHPGVPIVLESDPTLRPARNTVAEVYEQIVSDFTVAMDRMTMARGGPFMFTREAAQALLSRVYLYMEDHGSVIAMANAVIGSGKYSLVEGQAYIDQFATGGSSEAIFELQSTDTDNRGSDSLGGMYRASGYGDFLPAKDLLDRIDPADIRWQMFVEDPNLVGMYASHRVNKWPTRTSADNVPVIRLSEVYLNRAEAYARSGNDAAAQADLDRIRQRGLATAPPVTATGQALLDEILLERRIELGYEGHRIFDITRHRLDVVRNDCTGEVCFYPYPGPFVILPIPMAELDANPNIQQNPGYGGSQGGMS
jgi:hypothetical protein